MSSTPLKKPSTQFPDMQLLQQRLNAFHDWKGVQPIVRKSILDLSHVIRVLDSRILYLQGSISNKIRIEIVQKLKGKANAQDMLCVFKDINKLTNAVNEKSTFDDVRDIVATSINKAQPAQRATRKLYDKIQSEMKLIRGRMDNIQSMQRKQQSILSNKLIEHIKNLQSKWVKYQSLQRQIQFLKQQHKKKSKKFPLNNETIKQAHQDIAKNLSRISEKISSVCDKPQNRIGELQRKSLIYEQNLKQMSNKIINLQDKTNQQRNQSIMIKINQLESMFSSIQKQLNSKLTIRDLQSMPYQQTNIQNKLIQLQQIFNNNKIDYDNIFKDQSLINQTLCQQTSYGRWIWHSGNTLASKIPWEVQLRNLLPDILKWDKGSTGISLLQPGIYRISIIFFTTKRFSCQLFVNNLLYQTLHRRQGSSNCLQTTASLQGQSLIQHSYKGQDSIGLLFVQKI